MKKLTITLALIAGIIVLYSCQKEIRDPKLDNNKTISPAMYGPADGSAYVLEQAAADSNFPKFKWSSVKYDLSNLQGAKYDLQMSYHYLDSIFDSISMSYNYTLINGNTVIATTGDTSYQTTVSKLNQILLNNHQQVNKPDTVEFSVQAYLTTSTPYTDAESDKIMLIITPYQGLVTYAALYVPGDYQGWAPDVAPKIYSFENDGIYTGYIYFPAGGTYEFKFTSDPDWDHTNYGVGADTTLLNTDPTAGNLSVWAPGGYYFTVNTNDLTWTKTLENWGVIGEWLGWSTDIKLNWDITTEDLSVVVNGIPAADNQRFKFRANDAWDINLGAIDPPDGKTLTQGGADIPIPNGGNLKFILRFTTPEPTYEVIPQ